LEHIPLRTHTQTKYQQSPSKASEKPDRFLSKSALFRIVIIYLLYCSQVWSSVWSRGSTA